MTGILHSYALVDEFFFEMVRTTVANVEQGGHTDALEHLQLRSVQFGAEQKMWLYFDRLGSIVTERVKFRYPTAIFFAGQTVVHAAALLTGRLRNGQTVLATRRREAAARQVGQIR